MHLLPLLVALPDLEFRIPIAMLLTVALWLIKQGSALLVNHMKHETATRQQILEHMQQTNIALDRQNELLKLLVEKVLVHG